MAHSRSTITTLTEETLVIAVQRLTRRDRDLRKIVRDYGPPPLWARPPGVASLAKIILEQQVSLASGEATYQRLRKALPSIAPEHLLTLDDDAMRACTISRQKTRYLRILAEAVLKGTLDLEALGKQSDEDVAKQLMHLTGIGQWTADVYRLMCLARPDIWPCGDVALAKALQEVKQLSKRPSLEAQLDIAQSWRPYRAAAARMLWHHYLCKRGRKA